MSVILPYLQTNKLASYCFMNAGRRYETPVSETKDLITKGTASSMSMVLVSVPMSSKSHGDDICGPSGFLYMQWVIVQEKSTVRRAREPTTL